jgi:hypothetical protein
METINIQNGGEAEGSTQFAWTTTASGSIRVTAANMPNGNPWFTPSPCDFTGPASGELSNQSNVVTPTNDQSPPQGWGYTANVLVGTGHVIVEPTMPGAEHKKAS